MRVSWISASTRGLPTQMCRISGLGISASMKAPLIPECRTTRASRWTPVHPPTLVPLMTPPRVSTQALDAPTTPSATRLNVATLRITRAKRAATTARARFTLHVTSSLVFADAHAASGHPLPVLHQGQDRATSARTKRATAIFRRAIARAADGAVACAARRVPLSTITNQQVAFVAAMVSTMGPLHRLAQSAQTLTPWACARCRSFRLRRAALGTSTLGVRAIAPRAFARKLRQRMGRLVIAPSTSTASSTTIHTRAHTTASCVQSQESTGAASMSGERMATATASTTALRSGAIALHPSASGAVDTDTAATTHPSTHLHAAKLMAYCVKGC